MPQSKRILVLHTVPDHYFNCMIDALARRSDYAYMAAFVAPARTTNVEAPLPQRAQFRFLTPKGAVPDNADPFTVEHADWRADLLPLKFDAAVVAGYAARTQREVIGHCHRAGIPVAMFSDSNLRSQRGRSLKMRLKRALKKRMLAPVIRDVDALLTANSLGVAYWRYYGAPREKIHLCPYYADYDRVERARETQRAEVLAAHGFSGGDKLIVTAARLVPVKGLDLMIGAFRESGLAARGYKYAIAGTGPLEGQLKALAGDALNRSIFFLGFQQPTQLLALIRHACLFAFPSTYEPHGIVVHESLAAGTPVLSSDVSGSAYDLVIPGRSGFLFRSGDQARLLAALRAATADEAALAAMRVTARATFDEWFARTNPVMVIDRLMHRWLEPAAASPAPPAEAAR